MAPRDPLSLSTGGAVRLRRTAVRNPSDHCPASIGFSVRNRRNTHIVARRFTGFENSLAYMKALAKDWVQHKRTRTAAEAVSMIEGEIDSRSTHLNSGGHMHMRTLAAVEDEIEA